MALLKRLIGQKIKFPLKEINWKFNGSLESDQVTMHQEDVEWGVLRRLPSKGTLLAKDSEEGSEIYRVVKKAEGNYKDGEVFVEKTGYVIGFNEIYRNHIQEQKKGQISEDISAPNGSKIMAVQI
jgi:hypothetical protein